MWDELGIAPCDDPKAIRRAYAARLKTLDPDRDPAAFARLRQALESALAEAEEAAWAPVGTRTREDEPAETPADDVGALAARPQAGAPRSADECEPPIASEPAEHWLDVAPRERALMEALESALDRGEAAEAAKLYRRAAAGGLVPLQGAPAMLERLFAVALREPMLDRGAFRELARACGWDKAERGDVSDVRGRVLARLAAEEWHDVLVATAARRKGGSRKHARVARLMLGRIGRFWRPRMDRDALKIHLDQYQAHGTWLRDRIDPAWVRRLETWRRRREIVRHAILTLIIVALLADGIGVFIADAVNGTLSGWEIAFAPVFAAFLLWIIKLAATALYRLARARVPAG